MTADQNADLPTPVVAALTKGNKIEAIKLLRAARGIGLKESKEAVDAYIESRPDLRRQLAEVQKASAKKLLTWLIFLAVLIWAIYSSVG